MPQIIFFPSIRPDPDGIGGHHRLYQVQNDILSFSGAESYKLFERNQKKTTKKKNPKYYWNALSERIKSIGISIDHKFYPPSTIGALISTSLSIKNSLGWVPGKSYRDFIDKNGKPKMCVIDHPSLFEVADYNRKNFITTIYCPSDLLSFSKASNRQDNSLIRRESGINWLVEQEFLALCDEYLMISKVEKYFMNGLGLPAIFYPYMPVDQIRKRMLDLRNLRSKNDIDRDLILMIGSAFWGPIGEGFRWVLRNIQEKGLPENKRMIVGGSGTENFIGEFGALKNVEFRGRLEQEELNALLQVAGCMLIPQRSGFGAVTRIPEMACAGIPSITAEHAAAAINIPPGVCVLPDSWESWEETMKEISNRALSNTLDDYEKWENDQPKPLKQVFEKFLT
jgi:hypothetical protein